MITKVSTTFLRTCTGSATWQDFQAPAAHRNCRVHGLRIAHAQPDPPKAHFPFTATARGHGPRVPMCAAPCAHTHEHDERSHCAHDTPTPRRTRHRPRVTAHARRLRPSVAAGGADSKAPHDSFTRGALEELTVDIWEILGISAARHLRRHDVQHRRTACPNVQVCDGRQGAGLDVSGAAERSGGRAARRLVDRADGR